MSINIPLTSNPNLLTEAIEAGCETAWKYQEWLEHKQMLKCITDNFNTEDGWERIPNFEVRKLFIYKFFSESVISTSLEVGEYLSNDGGEAQIENYFSNSEINEIKRIDSLSDIEFIKIVKQGVSSLEFELGRL